MARTDLAQVALAKDSAVAMNRIQKKLKGVTPSLEAQIIRETNE